MNEMQFDLNALFSPKAIALVGISKKDNRSTLAYKNLLQMGYQGRIYFVNPKYDFLHGQRCYEKVSDIPDDIDSVYISIPGENVLPILKEAHLKGAKGAVVISSGFGEGDGVGKEQTEELKKFAKENRFAICGPNCLGLISTPNSYSAYGFFFPNELKKGNVGGVFQSGGLMHAIAGELSQRGVGISTIVSSGNEIVTDGSHYLEYLAGDPNTDVIIGFLEGIKNTKRFLRAAEIAYKNKKPIIVVKVGKSEKAAEAAVAHTGSMTGSDIIIDTVFKEKGIIRVDDVDELIETVILFSNKKYMTGNNLAVTTTSGGEAGMYADLGEDLNIKYAHFQTDTKRKLEDLLPDFGSMGNPLDTTGNAALDKDLYTQCLSLITEDPNVDIVAVSQMDITESALSNSKTTQVIVESIQECSRNYDKPLLCFTPNSGGADKKVCSMLMEKGIPLLIGAIPSLKAIRNLSWYSSLIKVKKEELNPVPQNEISLNNGFLESKKGVLPERESQEVLKKLGIEVAEKTLVNSSEEASKEADKIGYPVVMKIESADIPHKTDAGGVKLNLNTPQEVKQSYEDIMQSVSKKYPNANINGVVIEEMVEEGLEVIVGAKVDPMFGPIIVLGSGGVLVELLKDSTTRLAPINEPKAKEMINETRISKLLMGYRGKEKYDVKSLANVIAKLSYFVHEQQYYLEEIEINPLLVLPEGKGCIAVDGLITLKSKVPSEISVTQ